MKICFPYREHKTFKLVHQSIKILILRGGTMIVARLKNKEMKNQSTVVWMHPGFEQRERDLQAKGYVIQKIQANTRVRLYDEVPDMIIYSEDLLSENSLFFKINQFFPDTIAISIGTGTNMLPVQGTLKDSMNKLIEEIKTLDSKE